jgi:hypothetical protein
MIIRWLQGHSEERERERDGVARAALKTAKELVATWSPG